MIAIATPFLILGGVGGAWMIRAAWRDRRHERRALTVGGWAVIAATILLGALFVGPVKGGAVGVAMVSLGALLVVAQGLTRRAPRDARRLGLAPEPLEGRSRAWRGWLKALLAGPLGMTAAMGVAFCYATWVPGDPRTRIIVGGLMVPVLWGLAMTWTLADQRLLRATAVLGGTTIVSFGLATLGSLA